MCFLCARGFMLFALAQLLIVVEYIRAHYRAGKTVSAFDFLSRLLTGGTGEGEGAA